MFITLTNYITMNANQQSKLNRLVARKKVEDTTGFLKAQQEGRLLEYLENDLREAGLDPALIRFDSSNNITANSVTSSSTSSASKSGQSSSSSTSSPPNFDVSNYISYASIHLDSFVFEPYFRSQSNSKDHSALIQKLSSLHSFKKVSKRLETLKVLAFSLGVVCAFSGLRSLSFNPLLGLVQLLLAHDGLRISFNCFIRQYLLVSFHCLTGDLSSLGSTVMQVTSAALGFSSRPDPLTVLEHGVYWKAIFYDTVSSFLYSKVRLCLCLLLCIHSSASLPHIWRRGYYFARS